MPDRPIEIKVVGLYSGRPAPLLGRAADGRQVEISFVSAQTRDVPLDADFLLDVSGSMRDRVACSPEGHATKWDAVLAGLAAASGKVLTARDAVTVWTFSGGCRRIERLTGDRLGSLDIPFEGGGTELAEAVAKVSGSRREANILLVTDGKSWGPIDVQKAVETGARFTIVLIGEDALESSVGYFAAMTGGQMFIASGENAAQAVAEAVAAMRGVASPAIPFEGRPVSLEKRISGVTVAATWSEAGKEAPIRKGEAAAWAAYAAQLALAGMKDGAAEFAAEEGIVSHLTSIVLVDEAAEVVEGIPATRKVALPDPVTAVCAAARPFSLRELPPTRGRSLRVLDFEEQWPGPLGDPSRVPSIPDLSFPDPSDFTVRFVLKAVQRRDWLSLRDGSINWDSGLTALANGSLQGLPAFVSLRVVALSSLDEVKRLADALGKSTVAIALALLAGREADRSRGAARLVRAVVGNADKAMLEAARRAAGL